MNDRNRFSDQVRLAVQISGAAWCARVRKHGSGWEAESVWGSENMHATADWIAHPMVADWLDRAVDAGRVRSRRFKPGFTGPASVCLTAFPINGSIAAFLVASGNGGIDTANRAIFKALTLIPAAVSGSLTGSGGDEPAPDESTRTEFMRIAEQIGSLDITELDLESVLRRSVERAAELVHGAGAELGLFDAPNQAVRVLWSDLPGRPTGQYSVPFGQDVIGRVAASGKVLVVNDYPGWPDRVLATDGCTALVGVPLKYKGEVIGTLSVGAEDADAAFTREDARLLELLASQVSISIRNARLFQELGDRIRAQRAAEIKMVEAARLAAIGEMAAGIAHELNNPLTAISGFSELLIEEFPEGSPQRENMALVLQEARRARKVVRRLLDFSRREDALKTSVNVTELVSEVLALVQPLAQIHQIAIRFEAWDDLPRIYGDQSQLRQVLVNLVTNGIQAMSQGGELLVQTSLEEGPPARVVIQVRDSGEGIPETYLPQIFEPFFTTKPVGSGTGLGLSISRNIIQEHGGEIRVESEAGQGAVFTVVLPVDEDGFGQR